MIPSAGVPYLGVSVAARCDDTPEADVRELFAEALDTDIPGSRITKVWDFEMAAADSLIMSQMLV